MSESKALVVLLSTVKTCSHKHLAALLTWTCTHAHKYSTRTHKHMLRCLTVGIEFHYCSLRARRDLQPRPQVQLHSLTACLFCPFQHSATRVKQHLTSIHPCRQLRLSNLFGGKEIHAWKKKKKKEKNVGGYTPITDAAKIGISTALALASHFSPHNWLKYARIQQGGATPCSSLLA